MEKKKREDPFNISDPNQNEEDRLISDSSIDKTPTDEKKNFLSER